MEVIQLFNLIQDSAFDNPQRGRVYSIQGVSPCINGIGCEGCYNNIPRIALNTDMELPKELEGKKFRIRKLTPRECMRLMDVYDTDIDKMIASGLSNSSLYKLAGNSIVVNVLYHIFRKMFVETEIDVVKGEPTQLTLF